MYDTPIPKRLRLMLDNLGLTQKELAMMTGLTDSAISHYLSGDRLPHAGTLINISTSTNVSPNWILGFGSDDKMEKL